MAWLLKLQFKMLSPAVLNRDCYNITLKNITSTTVSRRVRICDFSGERRY